MQQLSPGKQNKENIYSLTSKAQNMHVSGALHLAVCLSLTGGLLPARTIICVQPHPGPLVQDEGCCGQGCPLAPAECLLLDLQAILRPKGCFPGLH